MESISIPFQLNGMYGGAARLEGFAALTPDGLALEYRLSDTIVGVFTGEVQTCVIPFVELQRAACGLGFFMPWLAISSRKMSTFDKFPTKEPGQLCLRVRWKHRRQLRALTSEINLQLSYLEADRYRRHFSDQGQSGQISEQGANAFPRIDQ